MIRRSTLVFLTCIAALGSPIIRTSAVGATDLSTLSTSQTLIAQASGGTFSGDLALGSRGAAVRSVQERLQQSEYYTGPVDGIYGIATQRAVSAFQTDAGLRSTGAIDEATYQQLRSATSNRPSAPNSATNAATATPGGTDGNVASAPTAPATAPTASELPAADGAPIVVEGDEGGLGGAFGIGLAIAAVLASFGIGFFIANRSKSNQEDADEWGEIEQSSQPLAITPGGIPQGGPNTATTAAAIGTNNGNGAITPPAASALQSGQMGGTAPLAQVDVIEGLIGDLRNPEPARRRKAIWELGQRGNSLAMQPLVDSMVNADSKEKSLVLAALSEIGIRSLKPMSRALAIALQDDNPEVRKNAIRDLTRVYDLVVQISQMLGHATEDEDAEVRQTATWALEQLNRIRRSQDIDANVRTLSGGSGGKPIDAADRFAL